MYNLFLDDLRNPYDCSYYMINSEIYRKEEWCIARNYDEFCSIITAKFKQGEFIDHISFDHDLGDVHYGIPCTEDNYNEVFVGLGEKTGLDCAKWLCNFCLENSINPPKNISIHTQNTVGFTNIKSYLENFKKFLENSKL